MKGKIFLVPFGKQGTTEFLFQNAIKERSGNNFSDILYIGPTPRKIRDAQLTFTSLVQTDTFISAIFSTVKQFASDFFLDNNQDKRKLPDYIQPLLIQKLKPDISIGYAKKISVFIRDIKQYLPDLSPQNVEKHIIKILSDQGQYSYEEVKKQILEATEILSKYNDTLAKNNWLDSEDILNVASKMIKNNCQVNTLILDGYFYDLTKLEENILSALIDKSAKIYALAFYDRQNPDIYALPQPFLSFLRKSGDFEEIDVEHESLNRTALPYCETSSIEDEVETIASLLKSNFNQGKLKLNRSIVTFTRLAEYESIVRRIFTKYGIPHTIYLAKNLAQTSPVITVLELLNSIINNFSRLSTVTVLSSPYFKRFSSETREWVGYYSKKGLIIKDAADWRGFDKRVFSVLEAEGEISKKKQQVVEQIQKEINLFIALVDKFRQPHGTLSSFAQALIKLLVQLRWCENLDQEDKELLSAKNEFYKLLGSLENFETEFGATNVADSDFYAIIKYLLDWHQVEPEITIKGVPVLEFSETRGLDCDHLFFGGLSEDKFPGQLSFDPILPEWLKVKLGLFSDDKHLARARFHYFRLVNTARIDTFLSCYNTQEDRLFLPSPLLDGESKTPPAFNTIFSDEQKQRAQGNKTKIALHSVITQVDFTKDSEAQKILRAKFGPGHRISVTKIEQYPRCPYRFYIEKVLDIEPMPEPRYEVEARIWGNVAHHVFEKLYKTEVVAIEKLPAQLENILASVLQNERLSPFWAEVARRIFTANIPYYVRVETDLRSQGYTPMQVERYFVDNIAQDIKISGIIDRIDLNKNDKKANILDYKTGRTPSITNVQIEKGAHLQLPLYIYLVMKSKPNWSVNNAGIYSLVDNEIKWLDTKKTSLTQIVDYAIKNARRFVYNIRQGLFHLPPENLANCGYCDYHSICPIVIKQKFDQQIQNNFEDTPLFNK